jgi:NADPH-dependent curcumin reductase CurA
MKDFNASQMVLASRPNGSSWRATSGLSLRRNWSAAAYGEVRYQEDFIDGLENAPTGLISLLEGKNFGKLIVRVSAR